MNNPALNLNVDTASAFQSAMFDAGIVIDELPIADGELHRFKVSDDKNGSRNGWYVLFGDRNPKGCFGSWKLGINETWSLKNYSTYTPQEKAEYAKQMAQARDERKKAQAITHKEARSEADKLWSDAKPETGSHKYLEDKGVQAYRIRSSGANLLIPLRDSGGILHSIQTIDESGKKLFLSGGAIQGHYFSIGKPNRKIIIAEGYSTAATIHQATGHATAVSFNAGNILPVAKALRERFPDIEIIIAGDNDSQTEGNPGKSKATEAALAVNGRAVIPEFINTETKPTDFNDLAALEGIEQVKKLIDSTPGIEEPQEITTTNQIMIQKINELALLSTLEYEQVRKKEAKSFGIRESALDKEVSKERKRIEQEELDDNSIVSNVEEWPEAIQGEELLSELESVYKRYVILPDGAAVALSLWTLGTYCFDAFRIYPMVGLSSPEKRCGKSTVMSLLQALTNKSLLSSNISPAAIYRVTELCKPTLLIDEADTFMRDNDELRGIINAGHTRDTAYVIKCDGEQNEPKKFSTWAPKALAMIGDLPDTNKDRSIVISMRRKMSGEVVLKMPLNASEQFLDIRRKCKRWATDNFDQLTRYVPTMPSHNNDREIDNWTPLFTIAGVCGNEQTAQNAMVSISLKDEDDGIGVMILADIKEIFDTKEMEKIFSQDLVDDLINLDDRPWCEWKRGKPITKNSLARLLKPYKIKSKSIRIGPEDRLKGYSLESFKDAFNRYLPPDTPFQSVTTGQTSDTNALSPISKRDTKDNVTFQKPLKPAPSNDCHGVTDENRDTGGNACMPNTEVVL